MGRSTFRCCGLGQPPKALLLHLKIGFDVAMGREWMGVAQKEGDNLEGDARLEHSHGGRMPKGMARDSAALE